MTQDVVHTINPVESPFVFGFGPAMRTIYRFSGHDAEVMAGLKRMQKRKWERRKVYEWTVEATRKSA